MSKTWLQKYGTYEEEVVGEATGIVARAGGGQASATALTKKWNEINTCASNGDSVKLLALKKGQTQIVFNNSGGGKRLSVFPQSGEYINNILNDGYLIGDGDAVMFICHEDGNCIVSAKRKEKIYRATLTQSGTSAPTVNEFENTIGTIVWTRSAAGVYAGTLTGAFPENKRWAVIGSVLDTVFTPGTMNAKRAVLIWISGDEDSVYIQTSKEDLTDFDGILNETAIDIRIYS